jgi:hypothetical protein
MVGSRADADVFRSLSEPLLTRPGAVCGFCKRELASGSAGKGTAQGYCEECGIRLLREED